LKCLTAEDTTLNKDFKIPVEFYFFRNALPAGLLVTEADTYASPRTRATRTPARARIVRAFAATMRVPAVHFED